MIQITPALAIDEGELAWSFLRASGPGGQHVNKTESAVQLRFDVRRSSSLPGAVAERLMQLAGSRLTREGVIVIEAKEHRSQRQNREEALVRLVALIRRAATPPRPRRPTRPTLASKERRLQAKDRRSRLKSTRRQAAEE